MPLNQNKKRFKMSIESKFAAQKLDAISGQDLSRKGSVDEPIKDLVALINSLPQYFTTSSCSGRILVLSENPQEVRRYCNKYQYFH